jgi:hypothetical protein
MPHSRTNARRMTAALTLSLAVALFGTPARAQSESEAKPDAPSDAALDALASQLRGKSGPSLSSVQVSGFGDFTWSRFIFTKKSAIQPTFGKQSSFYVGNLNLYVDAQLSERARSFFEVRFTYLPNGAASRDASTSTMPRVDNSAQDYSDLYRKTALGSIIIERAWVEYRLHELFTLRGGHLLTPYGIWNVDHGSPAIISVQRPFVVGADFIPKEQVGLEGYGTFHVSSSALLGYHAMVTNGRIGTHPQYLAMNGRPGFFGRVFAETNRLGELRVGVSGYQGVYKDELQKTGMGKPVSTINQQYDEWSMAADVHWDWHDVVLNAEYISNSINYKKGKPTRIDGVTQVNDDRRSGSYVLVAYRLPFYKQVMPYAMHEFFRASEKLRHEGISMDFVHYGSGVNDIYKYTVGINYHVQPNLVVKAQWDQVDRHGKNVIHWGDSNSEWHVQTAWAF